MATKSFRPNGEGTSRPNSSENGPQFFKIIFSRDELTTMRIPREFVRRHGKNLPKIATFEVPTGEAWKIELVHRQGRTWLAKGWEEFTKNYSIRDGHFLVFRYDAKSHFHVLIFDRTASEIKYPQFVSQDDVEILEDLSQKCSPNKRQRQEDEMPKTGSFCNRFKREIPCSDHQPNKTCADRVKLENSPSMATPKMGAAYQRAQAFKSHNPFHISVMHPTYLSSSNRLSIPLAFAKKHFPGKHNDLELVSSGRSWPARCILNSQHGRIYGWNAFVQDNKLKVGDVCILEMVKSKKLTVNVIIFPADD